MKVMPDGSRTGGWREFKEGMNLAEVMKASNVPAALKSTKPLIAPTPISWTKEEKVAMIEDEVGKRVGAEIEKFKVAYNLQTAILDKLAAFLLANHSDMINASNDVADTAISVMAQKAKAVAELTPASSEIKRLGDFLLSNYADKIGEGSAVDVVISLLSNVTPAPMEEPENPAGSKTTSGTKKS
jgi:hypothetical protein